MPRRPLSLVGILVWFVLIATPASAQSPSAEEMAAGRELITTMKLTDQLKALMPIIMKNLKAAMLVGRSPEFVRDFEALLPVFMATMEDRYGEVNDLMAAVYASNFTAQELRDMTAFYRTPTGQKMLQRLPLITQQAMQVGQAWGLKINEQIKQRMIEELRKKGHNI